MGEMSLTFENVSLQWERVSCILEKKGRQRSLLRDVCGSAHAGRLLAIMGPSGSGKTTLLNSLAGQLLKSKGLRLEGRVHVNGKAAHGDELLKLKKAYVRQEDIFYTQMTVRETLLFHAKLRLPRSMSKQEKEAKVEAILGALSLSKCADTLVGGEKVRGISGGERKRLNIGCELIASPSLIFLDEPTTGLDSFQADKVVRSLKDLAALGHTIVTVIHQPSGSVFSMFDDLMLLSEGRLVYHGDAQKATAHFKALGHPCPLHISPGEFCLSLVSVDHETADTAASTTQRVLDFAAAFAQSCGTKYALQENVPTNSAVDERSREDICTARPQASLLQQTRLLLARSWREVVRNKGANTIKVIQQVSTALIYGGIYSFSDKQSSIQDRIGLCSLVAIGNTNLAVASTIRAFPKEKSIVMNDRSKALYGALPYFLSKVVAEAPLSAALSCLFGGILYPLVGFQAARDKFLKFMAINIVHSLSSSATGLMIGAVAPSSEVALAMLPPIVVLQVHILKKKKGLLFGDCKCTRALTFVFWRADCVQWRKYCC